LTLFQITLPSRTTLAILSGTILSVRFHTSSGEINSGHLARLTPVIESMASGFSPVDASIRLGIVNALDSQHGIIPFDPIYEVPTSSKVPFRSAYHRGLSHPRRLSQVLITGASPKRLSHLRCLSQVPVLSKAPVSSEVPFRGPYPRCLFHPRCLSQVLIRGAYLI